MNDNDAQAAKTAAPLPDAGWREGAPAPEPREQREKRLRIRCWRRGTREMDLILGRYADARLASMSDAELDAFEALIREDDATLYKWMSGGETAPALHAAVIAAIQAAGETAL